MPQQIHHKKNEIQDVELFEDKECTEAFDFMDKKDLYIELVSGDITPLVRLRNQAATWQNIYTPYLCEQFKHYEPLDKIKTLDDINLNLSKYIPKDNAVLFLSEEDMEKYYNSFRSVPCCANIEDCYSCYFCGEAEPSESHVERCYIKDLPSFRREKGRDDFCFEDCIAYPKLITIFLPHGTQSELQKAKEVAKELKEKYGVEEVNLFVLHCFVKTDSFDMYLEWHRNFGNFSAIDKLITTNSTSILPVQDNERLQVIDCKEIFEEYLKENN